MNGQENVLAVESDYESGISLKLFERQMNLESHKMDRQISVTRQ